jgi:hypothetical protein
LLELSKAYGRVVRQVNSEKWSGPTFDTGVWNSYRETLVKSMSEGSWMSLAMAFLAIEGANAKRRDGSPLQSEDHEILTHAREQIESALKDATSRDPHLARQLRLMSAEAHHVDRPDRA